jgi:malate dehydrogenase (oxaloacetate-decarboxylating)
MTKMSYFERSTQLHEEYKGKIQISQKFDVETKDDLSLVYSPGVAGPCLAIAENKEKVYDLTIKGNTVAVVSDGSAVLGLGNIGAEASIPVMEGKALLFKKFAGIDAFPICLASQDTETIINTVRNIAPVFGGINLEDIAAPKCFEIEEKLQDLGIPVFHDDQHGTAIVTLAALINAAKVVGKNIEDLKVVINGAGAAGIAIAKILKAVDAPADSNFKGVKDILICDTVGIISKQRTDLNIMKSSILSITNINNVDGDLHLALQDADVFIGVSKGDLLKAKDIQHMANDSIIFALANPTPEISPEEAYKGGAKIIGTGRSDLPNQINNVLGFPGIFRGALDAKAKAITPAMKMAAAYAISEMIETPNAECIIPASLDEQVAINVAKAVYNAAHQL